MSVSGSGEQGCGVKLTEGIRAPEFNESAFRGVSHTIERLVKVRVLGEVAGVSRLAAAGAASFP